jgi:hypothetical protein
MLIHIFSICSAGDDSSQHLSTENVRKDVSLIRGFSVPLFLQRQSQSFGETIKSIRVADQLDDFRDFEVVKSAF